MGWLVHNDNNDQKRVKRQPKYILMCDLFRMTEKIYWFIIDVVSWLCFSEICIDIEIVFAF